MFEKLKLFCQNTVQLSPDELDLIDHFFEEKTLKKKEMLLQNGNICNFLAYIEKGTIRYFHLKDGNEKTCDIAFDHAWVTDFKSFTQNTPAVMNLQAMEETRIFTINQTSLQKLYQKCSTYETFGRIMAEQVAQRATEIAMSLSSDKPEERFIKLLNSNPDLFQRVPQKYIANFLGISPESLSRIQKRILIKQKSGQ